MSKIGEALRRKFRSPQDALKALGLDENILKENEDMANIRLSPGALVAKGAVLAKFPKLMAMDSAVIDPVFQTITGKNYAEKKKTLALAIKGLAQDASMDDIHSFLDSLDNHEEAAADTEANSAVPSAEDEAKEDEESERRAADARKRLGRDESEEERDEREKKESAEDAKKRLGRDESEEERKKREAQDKKGMDRRRAARDAKRAKDAEPAVTKKAMDEAIAGAVTEAKKQATADALKIARDIREAERAVRPWVGDLSMAFDSADEVYRAALKALGIKTEGKHPSAFPDILQAQPKPNARQHQTAHVAMDSAAAKSFEDAYPAAARIQLG